ncbi:MAG: hypothetical protein J3Q66DRAFT_373412 [Benniella sp.]|nr:MAG: hypothetical protein J3Q66DRAFT_373412 [Benniella sp.]
MRDSGPFHLLGCQISEQTIKFSWSYKPSWPHIPPRNLKHRFLKRLSFVDVPGEDGNCRSRGDRWLGFTAWVPLLVRIRFVGRERSLVSVMVPGASWLSLVGSIIWSDTCSVSIPLEEVKLVLVVSGTMCSG